MKNFELQPKGKLSQQLIEKELLTFIAVAEWVKNLAYQRISDKSNLALTISENCGTCSSKHAFLKAVLNEQGIKEVSLHIGIFKMNGENTKGISDILEAAQLEYIPEAHCYLKYKNTRFDYTSPSLDLKKIEAALLQEIEIEPSDVGAFKSAFHQKFIQKWLEKHKTPQHLEEVWTAREACIARLGEVF